VKRRFLAPKGRGPVWRTQGDLQIGVV